MFTAISYHIKLHISLWQRAFCTFEPLINKFPILLLPIFTLDGENESDHLASSINLVIDVLIVIQLIEHLDCCLSLFKVLRYIAQQPACSSFGELEQKTLQFCFINTTFQMFSNHDKSKRCFGNLFFLTRLIKLQLFWKTN